MMPRLWTPTLEATYSLFTSLQWNEVRDLFQLALPTIIVQLSFVVPPFLAASHVGRTYGYVALDGYTLAWGTGNLSTLALLQGIFNACDTLAPRAFGAHQYRQVGFIAIRGFVATLLVIAPVNSFVLILMDKILRSLGQDSEATAFACQFYPFYATSYPFYALYAILWKFLAAQNTLAPMVVSTMVCTTIVLPLSLRFFTHWFGFVGVALAITFFYLFECVWVICWLWRYRPHHIETWPGLKAWSEALKWKPFLSFLVLGTGGMLAYLEWVYWEVLTVIIGTYGAMPLSAHTVPRQFTDIGYVIPLGIAIALAIRMGSNLSKSDVTTAKRLAQRTFILSVVTCALASFFMYIYRDVIVQMFTTELSVVEICKEIWFDSCLYFFMFCLFGINSGISIGLGMQFTFGAVTTVCMWCIGMPSTYYFAVLKGGGVAAVWACIWPPYLLVNVCMGVAFLSKDWGQNTMQPLGSQPKKVETDIESLRIEAPGATPKDEIAPYKRKASTEKALHD